MALSLIAVWDLARRQIHHYSCILQHMGKNRAELLKLDVVYELWALIFLHSSSIIPTLKIESLYCIN